MSETTGIADKVKGFFKTKNFWRNNMKMTLQNMIKEANKKPTNLGKDVSKVLKKQT